jgi:two-component system, cell cycle sensor histidine kinase and response regulator CckA
MANPVQRDASPPGLASRLLQALAAPAAEVALRDALEVLSELGIVRHEPGGEPPWLTVEHAGRALSLAVAAEPPGDETRALVESVVRVGLRRAADDEQHRTVEERLDMLSAASFEGIFVHIDGVVIDANRRVEEMLGYDHGEVLGDRTLRQCVAPEDLPGVLQRMAQGIEGEYVITGVRKDGTRFRAELLTKQGKLGERPVRVVAVRDVTERERTHALLRESEARLRDLAAATFDVTVLSRDGVVVDVLGGIEAVLGYRPEEVRGRKLLDFVAPPSLPLATEIVAEGRVGAYQCLLAAASGEHVPVEIVGVTSTLDGEPVRVGAIRDLRAVRRQEMERRKLEQQLEQSQRLESLGVLAGGIAHDFNNLLVGVIGNAELLLGSLTDPEDLESVRGILAAGRRAAALTAQMLAYAGRRELGRREPLDLGAMALELRTLLDAALSKKARLDIVADAGCIVNGDRATLTQVLMNLLTNASDALEGNAGHIRVSVTREGAPDARWDRALGATVGPGDWVLVEVSDTGSGMEAATMSRVFEPFFTTKQKGHGLGLAASLGIVSSHGGAVLVESRPGSGSTFSVLLPGAPGAHELPVTGRDAEHVGSLRVLVVDDEAIVRRNLRRVLELRGHVVEEAPDGVTGLARVEAFHPDVIVLDMTMPDVDGAEVLRRLRARGSRVPVVLSSGYMEVAQERGLDRTAFQGFLVKPYGVAELLEVLERALAARSSGG